MNTIPETRGAKRKYDFAGMTVKSYRDFTGTTTGIVLNCAKSYAKTNGLDWEFACRTVDGVTRIYRVK